MLRESKKRIALDSDLLVLIGILLAFCVWILSLPCFPSTDGPVHLYYANILRILLARSPSPYTAYFHIRHLLPPYALYYYSLVLLSRAVPMFLADQLIICLYFALFVFGFRYLAQALGPSGKLTSPLVTLLLLNWPLGMGFLSFCLSLSLTLWALGLWLRVTGRPSHTRRIGFAVLTVVVMFTHPVPLLLLLFVTGALLAVRFSQASQKAGRLAWPGHGRADLVTFGAATLNLLYLQHFATAHPFDQNIVLTHREYVADVLSRFTFYGREHSLAFFLGRRADLLVYRAGLLLVLIIPLGLALLQFVRNRRVGRWTEGDTLLTLGLTAIVVLPFIPTKLNECFYFPDRLLICLWLAFLLAASSWSPRPGPRAGKFCDSLQCLRFNAEMLPALFCVFTVVVDGTLLYSSDRLLRPIAESIAAVGQPEHDGKGQIGFLMEDARKVSDDGPHEALAWNPYYWALVNVFRANDEIMGNAPWMDESIIPIAPSAPLPEMSIPALQQPIPSLLQRDLLRSPDDLRRTLAVSSFYVVNQAGRPAGHQPPLRNAEDFSPPWTCFSEGWYRICRSAAWPTQKISRDIAAQASSWR